MSEIQKQKTLIKLTLFLYKYIIGRWKCRYLLEIIIDSKPTGPTFTWFFAKRSTLSGNGLKLFHSLECPIN